MSEKEKVEVETKVAETKMPEVAIPQGPPVKKGRRGDIKASFWDKLTPEQKAEHIERMNKTRRENTRSKKMMKDQLKTLLSLPVQNKKAAKTLMSLGIDLDNIDNQMLMLVVMWQQVLKGRANCVPAFNSIVNILGEAADKMDLNANLNMVFNNNLPEKDDLKPATLGEIEADVDDSQSK